MRTAWTDLATQLDWAGPAGLIARGADTRRLLADDGVSYRPPGGVAEQPWALDPLPVLLDAGRWAELAAGLAQRASCWTGCWPTSTGRGAPCAPGCCRRSWSSGTPATCAAGPAGRTPRPRRELFLAGADVARTEQGWQLISDRVQAPSGAGYAMANRRVVARVLPAVHRRAGIAAAGPVLRRRARRPAGAGPRRTGDRTARGWCC